MQSATTHVGRARVVFHLPSRNAHAEGTLQLAAIELRLLQPIHMPQLRLPSCLPAPRVRETLTFLNPMPWVVMDTLWCPLS